MNIHTPKPIVSLFALCGLFAFQVSITMADNVEKGKEKADLCVQCHGHDGRADNPLLPNLAGQNIKYFIKQMHDFKEKRRRSAPMREIANMLSVEDIENLAAYYHSLR